MATVHKGQLFTGCSKAEVGGFHFGTSRHPRTEASDGPQTLELKQNPQWSNTDDNLCKKTIS